MLSSVSLFYKHLLIFSSLSPYNIAHYEKTRVRFDPEAFVSHTERDRKHKNNDSIKISKFDWCLHNKIGGVVKILK